MVVLPRRPSSGLDGEGESLPGYEEGVELRNLITSLDVAKRGPVLVLHVAARAQEICRAFGTPILIAAARVKDIVKAYYAPGAPDAVYQGAAKVNCRETAETMYRRKPQVERL